ncbi:bacteriohemerythrin [Fusibacter tunisiensis]|uniref:Hemerythrin n=1 Tax=Fusibacter tunisiensis TaxID=1008308 RepID=A0ABS2MQR3_9FIRM|nr:bacteriohemerythrin [Fusibacter tunisiensis]MBM7561710.1 hemerythrin [Fusibacter tunisiensis]
MIKWDEKYEIGIQSIDNQHKELIRIAEDLSELLTNAIEGDDIYDEMVRIIGELSDYTVYHFKFEENLFELLNYEFKEAHKKEHDKLISEINALDLRAVDEDQVAYGKKILNFLITWVFKHISGTDFKYRDLFLSKGIK